MKHQHKRQISMKILQKTIWEHSLGTTRFQGQELLVKNLLINMTNL